MGRKQLQQPGAGRKGAGPSGTSSYPVVQNKDLFHRVNFAVQASVYLASLDQSLAGHTHGEDSANADDVMENSAGGPGVEGPDFGRLARAEMKSAKKLAVHNQVKCDPSFKRIVCKKCATVLVPGLTCRVRVRPSPTHIHVVHHTCLTCGTCLNLPAPPTSTDSSTQAELDGPVRAQRRGKVAKRSKVTFHDRERTETEKDGEGHTVWRGGQVVSGWGETVQGSGSNEGT